ncbi:MAG TPA: hypothetical protein PLJ37_02370 [Chitinophagales bacterium]|nr:hypothetical protein [Chitinophagales bacterium]HMV02619.1 hypothetical protein [Chitinophagales bacterium]HMW94445.1 hypothetical protein [Chitinophagales bacterium]HMY41492.1 hypothetical protein [Chitinophagales bacterium]HMZ68694.1 hypothetical protein [Chitinophagales bacterium]
MEIRSSLKKIDNYLKIVSDLNKAILDEGTMAPEELQIMKKYLYVCADRIEDIQIKFGLATTETENGILDNLKQNEEAEVTLTEFAEIESENQRSEEYDILKELEPSDENSLNVSDSIVDKDDDVINTVNEAQIVQDEQKVSEQNIKSDERILVEPVVFLSADLPSIRYNTLIDFDDYHQQIFDEKPEAKSVMNGIGEIQNNSNTLVADDVEKVEEKIEFKANVEIKEPIELVAETKEETQNDDNLINTLVADDVEKVEEKIEFKANDETKEPIELVAETKEETQNDDDSINTLVADDVEKVEEKIEFKTDNEVKNPIQLTSENSELNPSISTNIEEKTILVLDEVENDKILVDFEKKPETSEEREHFNLVDTANEQKDVNVFTKTTSSRTEYESIVNRKSLSEQIALNDKFIFVRELFASQFSEYESSIKEIDVFENYQDALDFCTNVLSVKYNWEARKNISERFLNILYKKYNL